MQGRLDSSQILTNCDSGRGFQSVSVVQVVAVISFSRFSERTGTYGTQRRLSRLLGTLKQWQLVIGDESEQKFGVTSKARPWPARALSILRALRPCADFDSPNEFYVAFERFKGELEFLASRSLWI